MVNTDKKGGGGNAATERRGYREGFRITPGIPSPGIGFAL